MCKLKAAKREAAAGGDCCCEKFSLLLEPLNQMLLLLLLLSLLGVDSKNEPFVGLLEKLLETKFSSAGEESLSTAAAADVSCNGNKSDLISSHHSFVFICQHLIIKFIIIIINMISDH